MIVTITRFFELTCIFDLYLVLGMWTSSYRE